MNASLSQSEFRAYEPSNNFDALVDVRSPEEYAEQHIPNSINIPLADLSDALPQFTQGASILFICKSGLRSMKAVSFAKAVGFSNTKSLEGGIAAWSNYVSQ
ncbi:rhodanese-like domain-containing protein [Hirschia litorea]|uniref:Rhodanese-like domain-containing protein n=1 Tax=Hirschia litorea TaxID=1199156 RepID=A0ABW2INN2_9PROT